MSLVYVVAAVAGMTCATPQICQPGHAKSLRLPYEAYRTMRDIAFNRAGIPTSKQCHKDDPRPDCVILDHILPLELCIEHCNDQSNLQVQSRAAAAAKDIEENRVTKEFCRGEITLDEAQSRFHPDPQNEDLK